MLLGSSVLDTAIGLIFVYLIVSIICSSFSEGVESVLRYRSKDLESAIRELLTETTGDPANGVSPKGVPQKDKDMMVEFYNHPLISSLFKRDYWTAKKHNELPAYIPSTNFALALMDIVGKKASMSQRAGTLDATAGTLAESGLIAGHAVRALRESAMAMEFEYPKVSTAIVALVDAAGTDANQARKNIEEWFNGSMDRASGWFKHRSQFIILAFGLALAAAANIDSLAIVRILSTDAGVREAMVDTAKAESSKPEKERKQSIDDLRQLGLPIGWDSKSQPHSDDPRGWAMKAIGILLTGLAVTMGAPFWFDVLNKIVVVRSTVKPAEKSPPEKSKA